MAIHVRITVFVPAHLVQNPAVTTAITRYADGTVVILANHVQTSAHGSVHTRSARSLAERSVTDRDATNHARSSYRAATRVLGFVAKFARSHVEFARRLSSERANLEQCSWNWLIVVMCLKLRRWTD